jgi:hypothetical protein
MSINEITTWRPTDYDTCRVASREMTISMPDGLCNAHSPDTAHWVARRLNLAAKLELLAYDYATGKTDGTKLKQFVRSCLSD